MRFFVLSVLLTLLPQAVAGQSIADARLAAVASSLPLRTPIRITVRGTNIEGRLLRARQDSLTLQADEGEQRVALAEIDTLWRLHRYTRRGAVVGAVAGGLIVGANAALLVIGLCEKPNCESDLVLLTGLGAAIGAGGGALLGAGIGSLARRWRRLYP